ncbi:class I SAM-dependent methyltransferase [Pleionea sp. CnH1-48]|uniref:class I SAM-dependent methyltransferase n=1 Tax=Pleionea sp. CnH1-48 TaxID=2954494 RepID=UPI0020975263|nr:class I SAM-dependent methyltransferase [Pleionea sp. CnH1-48]MCO7226140.1 class I SAM-dependent methyltransferase [Pleionea sp. CnH1-48]
MTLVSTQPTFQGTAASVGDGVRLLVFPLDIDIAANIVKCARSMQCYVAGSSSVMENAGQHSLDDFFHLPFITEDHFIEVLEEKIKVYDITHIYTPHCGIWSHLKKLEQDPDFIHFHLCRPNPHYAEWSLFVPGYEWAEQCVNESFAQALPDIEEAAVKPTLSKGQYAALHKQFIDIPGQCDVSKLTVLTQMSRILPQGDIVEVGAFYGRSAYAMAWLAARYQIGNVICVDPWENAKIETQGAQAEILNDEFSQDDDVIDFEKVYWGFIASVSLLNNIGYIRDISKDAVDVYRQAIDNGYLRSEQLEPVSVSGHIALLHIDGNHRYDQVCLDIETWAPYVMPGGWILLDDYVWAFGDGPQRAGDELLASMNFEVAFSASDTLFIRKSL